MLRTFLGMFRNSTPKRRQMIDKKCLINPISPNCAHVKAPQACNIWRSRPKVNDDVTAIVPCDSALLDLCQAAVLAL